MDHKACISEAGSHTLEPGSSILTSLTMRSISAVAYRGHPSPIDVDGQGGISPLVQYLCAFGRHWQWARARGCSCVTAPTCWPSLKGKELPITTEVQRVAAIFMQQSGVLAYENSNIIVEDALWIQWGLVGAKKAKRQATQNYSQPWGRKGRSHRSVAWLTVCFLSLELGGVFGVHSRMKTRSWIPHGHYFRSVEASTPSTIELCF